MFKMMKVFNGGLLFDVSAVSRAAGQTLIELIISILLFSVAILSGTSFFTLGNNSFERSRQVDYAMQFGYGNIQGLRVNYFDALYNGGVAFTATQKTSDVSPMPPTPGGYDYTCTTTFTPFISVMGAIPSVSIHVEVTWPGKLPTQVVDFDTTISSPVIGMSL